MNDFQELFNRTRRIKTLTVRETVELPKVWKAWTSHTKFEPFEFTYIDTITEMEITTTINGIISIWPIIITNRILGWIIQIW